MIEKLTKTLTHRKRTIRRVDLASRNSSPGRPPKLFERNSGKAAKREELNDAPASPPPKSKHSGTNLIRAFGRAIRKTASGENLMSGSSARGSRNNSQGSIKTISEDPSPSTTPPLPSVPFSPSPPAILLESVDIANLAPQISTTPSTPPKPLPMQPQSTKPLAFRPGAPGDRQRVNLGPTVSPLRAVNSHSNGNAGKPSTAPNPRLPRLRRTTSDESMRSVTTTVTHVTEGPQPEEAEPKAANFPREHLVGPVPLCNSWDKADAGL